MNEILSTFPRSQKKLFFRFLVSEERIVSSINDIGKNWTSTHLTIKWNFISHHIQIFVQNGLKT